MKIIYTKAEIQEVMQKHFYNSHGVSDDKRPIVEMTMSPQQIIIELGPVPEDDES